MDEQKKGTRRRGELLEKAILQAAWNELIQIGYTQLTMENVATRAETNKAVLYRRWTNKSELVIAAMRRYLPKISNEIPNTGNLRGDVYAYLHTRTELLRVIGAETIRGLMMEPQVWRMIIKSMQQMIGRSSENKITVALTTILKNAELRREICLEKLTPRIISLPWDLLRSEIITKQEPISDEVITEIVDDIFLPLVYTKSGNNK